MILRIVRGWPWTNPVPQVHDHGTVSYFLRSPPGHVLLACVFPAVLLAALAPANRYAATGFPGVDCEGPFNVLLFAVPVLLFYGAAALANGLRRQRLMNLVAAICCTLACVAVSVNTAEAVSYLRRNAMQAAGSCTPTAWPPGPG